nr:helix-hairpin-helix domain-containing protein [Burkholderia sp. WSM2232]
MTECVVRSRLLFALNGVLAMLKKLVMLCVALALSLSAGLTAAVEVNSADQAALESIKGIGPAHAKAIIEERTKNGPFRSADDLAARVKGIGSKSVVNLEAAGLTINGSSAPPAGSKSATTSASAKSPATKAAPAANGAATAAPATATTSAATTATPAAPADASGAKASKSSRSSKKNKEAAAASVSTPTATTATTATAAATGTAASAPGDASGAKASKKKARKSKAASATAASGGA